MTLKEVKEQPNHVWLDIRVDGEFMTKQVYPKNNTYGFVVCHGQQYPIKWTEIHLAFNNKRIVRL